MIQNQSKYKKIDLSFCGKRGFMAFRKQAPIKKNYEHVTGNPNFLTATKIGEDLMNDFQAKLHHADMMLKGLQAQKALLDKNAINVFHNFIKFACKAPQTLKELTALLGMGEKELTPFVDGLVQKGTLKKDGNKYHTNG